jgi:hypothetical protein
VTQPTSAIAKATVIFQSQAPTFASDYSGQGTPMTATELQGLVAPVALYPEAS